jgi:FlaA1/EpsC-like NDP-sugar epimerase
VLVLDMGEPVKIVELAKQLIRLAGQSADAIGIEFSGLRPGEKLYEELLADADTTLPTPIRQLRLARLEERHGAIETLLRRVRAAPPGALQRDAHALLREAVPEYGAV